MPDTTPTPAELAAHLYTPIEEGGHGESPELFLWQHATQHEAAREHRRTTLTHDHDYPFRYDKEGNPLG